MNIKSTRGLHNDKIKLLVYGAAGSGKTSFIGTGDTEHTLILSAEAGLLCLADSDIDVIEINHWNDLQAAYRWILTEGSKYTTIAIDSLTELSDKLVAELESAPEYKDPKNSFKMWGEYNTRFSRLIKAFRDLDRHVVITALPEDVTDGGIVIRKPYIKGTATQRLLESYFDEVFYIYVDPATQERKLQTQPTTAISAKDRSGKLAAVEAPNLTQIIHTINQKKAA